MATEVKPEEIAASILAKLVQVRRGAPVEVGSNQFAGGEQGEESAVDPVCGMLVEISGARYHSVLDGRDFYFCCAACKRQFERNPQEYLVGPDK